MICAQNSRHSLNQSDEKLKPITNRSPAFSRASGSLVVFTYCMTLTRIFLSSDWTVVVTTLLLVLRHSIEKRSKQYTRLTAYQAYRGWLCPLFQLHVQNCAVRWESCFSSQEENISKKEKIIWFHQNLGFSYCHSGIMWSVFKDKWTNKLWPINTVRSKIAFIFTSLSAVQIYDFHIFTAV